MPCLPVRDVTSIESNDCDDKTLLKHDNAFVFLTKHMSALSEFNLYVMPSHDDYSLFYDKRDESDDDDNENDDGVSDDCNDCHKIRYGWIAIMT